MTENPAPSSGARPAETNARPLLLTAGRYAWAAIGAAGVVVLLGALVYLLRLVVVPLVMALFATALLAPVANWLRARSVPPAVASLLSLVLLVGALGVAGGVLAPLVAAEAPALVEELTAGIDRLDEWLRREPLGFGLTGVDEVLDRLGEQVGADDEAVQAAFTGVEVIFGTVLALVASFFYLKDGPRFARALARLLPAASRPHAAEMARQGWATLGAYLRGLFIVALFDAVLIGVGLALLAVPLAVPLAVLVFFGGFFPIIGATATGALAVLVAFADGGLGPAMVVLALVVGVQQLESNVLYPYVVGRSIRLHPFVVLMAITAGAVTLGVLGAFLAVPLAATVARAGEYAQREGLLGAGDLEVVTGGAGRG